jgi:hypothetical protein
MGAKILRGLLYVGALVVLLVAGVAAYVART